MRFIKASSFTLILTFCCFQLVGQNDFQQKFGNAYLEEALQIAETSDLHKEVNTKANLDYIYCLLETRNHSKADSLLGLCSIENKDPLFLYFSFLQSKTLIKKRKLSNAENILQKALAAYESDLHPCAHLALNWESKAVINYLNKDFKNSKIHFRKALDIKLDCSASNYELVKAYDYNFQVNYFTSSYDSAAIFLDQGLPYLNKINTTNRYQPMFRNHRGVLYKLNGDFEKAIECYRKSIQYLKLKYPEPFHSKLLNTYNNLSVIYSEIEDFPQTVAYLDTMELILQKDTSNHRMLCNLLLMKSYYSTSTKKQEDYMQTILSYDNKLKKGDRFVLVQALNNLSVFSKRRGRFIESEDYLNRAIYKLEKLPNAPKEYIGTIYFNLASVLVQREKKAKAIESLHKSISTLENVVGKENKLLVYPMSALAEITDSPSEAKALLERTKSIIHPIYGSDHPLSAKIDLKESVRYKLNLDFLRSNQSAKKAARILEKNPAYQQGQLPKAYRNLAYSFHHLNQKDSSIFYYQKMLASTGIDFDEKGIIHIERMAEYQLWPALQAYNDYLKDFYELNLTQDLPDKHIKNIIQLISKTSSTFFLESSNFEFKKDLKELISILLAKQFESYEKNKNQLHLENILNLFEVYKQGFIAATFKKMDASYQKVISEDLLKEEKRIIFNYEKLYHQLNESPISNFSNHESPDSNIIQKLKEADFQKNAFYKKLEQQYPDYLNLGSNYFEINLSSLHQSLKENEHYLNNFWGTDFNYSLFITKDTAFVFRVSIDSLVHHLNVINDELSRYQYFNQENEFESGKHNFIVHAHALYQLLIAPFQTYLNQNDDLLIIPDNRLCYLPYDALVREANLQLGFKKLDYLFRHVNIRYGLRLQNALVENNSKQKKLNYMGFASSQSKLKGRPNASLISNIAEVQEGKKLFGGEVYIGAELTKSAFLNHANDARILHVAMHGNIDENFPGNSAFLIEHNDSTEYLNIYDIATKDFSNDLAILSACNSNQGMIAEGEGLISLTRAFQLAGSKNQVSTLWAVNDKTSSEIIVNFLNRIDQQDQYHAALRTAKLDYLNTHSEYYAHPSYWAAFNYYGDAVSFTEKSSTSSRIFIGLLFFILLAFFSIFLIRKL